MIKSKNNRVNLAALVIIGVLFGALLTTAVRFILYQPDSVHYHANFALYINGKRQELKGPGYYEEVQACVANNTENPKARVHMHNNINDVVHVHATAVTWGQFFANIGYTLGDRVLETVDGQFAPTDDKKLSFILNGSQTDSVFNKVIGDEDKLLVNYGDEPSSSLNERFRVIPHTAGEYDARHDPAGCAGSQELSFSDRLKTALGVNP